METDRLCLVDFTDLKSDNHLDGLATMNGDAEVMEFFPATLSQAESAAMLQRLIDHRAAHGYAPFALHKKDDNAFIGFTGLMLADFEAHFTPAVEIGWRFVKSAWGQGFATEAARACLSYGFDELGLTDIVSFTAAQNTRSIRVMEKIGMQHKAADDFNHPHLTEGHALRHDVLYRIRSSK